MGDKPPITFDAEGKVRVLEAEKFKQTEELEAEARAFVQSSCLAMSFSCLAGESLASTGVELYCRSSIDQLARPPPNSLVRLQRSLSSRIRCIPWLIISVHKRK